MLTSRPAAMAEGRNVAGPVGGIVPAGSALRVRWEPTLDQGST
jgi:hypothetical protein